MMVLGDLVSNGNIPSGRQSGKLRKINVTFFTFPWIRSILYDLQVGISEVHDMPFLLIYSERLYDTFLWRYLLNTFRRI